MKRNITVVSDKDKPSQTVLFYFRLFTKYSLLTGFIGLCSRIGHYLQQRPIGKCFNDCYVEN